LSVLMPISAPRPYSKPSAKRVLALTITLAESTSRRKRMAFGWLRGQDGVGVVAAVAVDVGDGLVHAVHHLDADDRGQVFLGPVGLGGVHQLAPGTARQDGLGAPGAAHLHALGGEDGADARQEGRRHAACTSSDSVALQGLYFCVLALSATTRAMARSTSAST
jgi:hypothetical protein